MSDTSPRLELPYLQPAQAQKHVTHNEALRRLDTLVQMVVTALDVQDPPAAPVPGELFALAEIPTGTWAGQGGRLALREEGYWTYLDPQPGWRVWDLDSGRGHVFEDGTWRDEAGVLQNIEGLGVGTVPDAANRLAVAADATLLTHAGGSHRLKVNKATTPDTATLLFQTGFDGRAEMGMAGEDAFSVKVRAEGGVWREALRIDPASEQIALAAGDQVQARLDATGLTLDVPVTGTAVQASTVDRTAGRLLTVGAFGMGGLVDLKEGADDYDTSFETGVSKLIGHASSSEAPAGSPFAGNLGAVGLQAFAAEANRGMQLMVQVQKDDGSNGRLAVRSYDDGWQEWKDIYTNEDILGAVSQTGGTPTGAILERGSNVNGSYVRWADGTQICWHEITLGVLSSADSVNGLHRSDTLDFVHSADFAAGSVVAASGGGGLFEDGLMRSVSADATRLSVRLGGVQAWSGVDAGTLRALCIGRWF